MSDFSFRIVEWYKQNGRELPWRNTDDPYKIWISEIILQQTRVDQGYDYYLKFIDRFPTVDVLANAKEDEVLKYWQGLGYYSRARNLHFASKQIMSDFKGLFPVGYNDILKLKGIGTYTAAAIVSFAYDQPYAVVDGNVYRVLSRVFRLDTPIDSGRGKKEFSHLAQELLCDKNPGTYNQAIMDFGALQCVPANPNCDICVLKDICLAKNHNEVRKLPVKQKKIKLTERYFHYFHIINEAYTYLQKRTKNDIWKNLYEFPLIESDQQLQYEDLLKNEMFSGIENLCLEKSSPIIKHVLSHQKIYARYFSIRISNDNNFLKQCSKIPQDELNKYPISRLMEIYLESL